MKSKILSATLALTLLAFANADYNVANYCQLVKPGTMLPSFDSCQNYYTCSANGQPVLSSCSPGNVFNKDSQQCVSSASYSCFYGLSNPCQNQDQTFVPSTTECNEWHYCENGAIAGTGTCIEGQIFNYASQSCVYGECSNTDSGSSNGVDMSNLNICQIMPNGIFFGDTQNCTTWHKCLSTGKKDGACPDGDDFDTSFAACVPPNSQYSNVCTRIQNPTTTGVISGPPANTTCVVGTSVGDPSSCSVYYTCVNSTQTNKTSWTTNTCTNQYFDVLSQQCNSTSLARPFTGCNRCQFTTGSTYWANAVNSNCSTYLTCSNGQESKSTPGDCGAGNFFNEALQYCMIGNTTLSQYAQTHGACQNYTCDQTSRVCTTSTTSTGTSTGTGGSTSGSTPGTGGNTSGSTPSTNSTAPAPAPVPAPAPTTNVTAPASG